jgi:hypothetical protein
LILIVRDLNRLLEKLCVVFESWNVGSVEVATEGRIGGYQVIVHSTLEDLTV